jgi:O-antigen/teichoic acid export membrane protein
MLTRLGAPTQAATGEMLGYGAWLTVSNVIGPLMVYLDRLVIGAVLAVSAVAYYSAPYEVITRLWIVPAALTGVLFPAFASGSAARLLILYRAGAKAILVSVFPVTLAAALFAPEWMRLWLGNEFAEQGARAAQWLSIGVMLNCLAYLPFTLMQARGRADTPAKIHLAELPFYLALLAALVHTHGIAGAAFAWAVRCAADALLLFAFGRRNVPEAAPLFTGLQWAIVGLAILALAGALAPLSLGARGIYLALVVAGFGASAWWILLDPSERALARRPMLLLAGER